MTRRTFRREKNALPDVGQLDLDFLSRDPVRDKTGPPCSGAGDFFPHPLPKPVFQPIQRRDRGSGGTFWGLSLPWLNLVSGKGALEWISPES